METKNKLKKIALPVLFCGFLLFGLRQPIPESGFFYRIRDGSRVQRVQGILRLSYVDVDGLNSVEGGFHVFVTWIAIVPSNALNGEPTGICFFDDDGDYSGFLPLSGDVAEFVESVWADDKAIELAIPRDGRDEKRFFSREDADIHWPPRGL